MYIQYMQMHVPALSSFLLYVKYQSLVWSLWSLQEVERRFSSVKVKRMEAAVVQFTPYS